MAPALAPAAGLLGCLALVAAAAGAPAPPPGSLQIQYMQATDCSFGVIAQVTVPKALGICVNVSKFDLKFRADNVTAMSLVRTFNSDLNYTVINYSLEPNCRNLVTCCLDFEYCSGSQIIDAGSTRVNSVRVVTPN